MNDDMNDDIKDEITNFIHKKIQFFYENNLVKKWPSNLVNANIAIEYAWRSETIFHMLESIIFSDELCLHKEINYEDYEIVNTHNFDLEEFPFYASNLEPKIYFDTLSISNWKYHEFILSALVFCIQNSLYSEVRMNITVYVIASNFAPIFLQEDIFSDSIFSCLLELNLFSFFPRPAVSGFLYYLTPSKIKRININDPKSPWSKFLYFFSYFPYTFIQECINDCKLQNNLAPLSLAFHVFHTTLMPDRKSKNIEYEHLKKFKKILVALKLINYEFIMKCNFGYFQDKLKKIPFKRYYSSFDNFLSSQSIQQQLKKTIGLPIILLFGIGGITVSSFRTNNDNPLFISGQQISSPSRAFRKAPSDSNKNFFSFQRRNRSMVRAERKQNLAHDRERFREPLFYTESVSHSLYNVTLEGTYNVSIGKKVFQYQIFTINGKSYYSICGISDKYKNLSKIKTFLLKTIAEQFPESEDILTLIFQGTDLKLEDDHPLVKNILEAFEIPRSEAHAAAVPGPTNSLRTNNTYEVEPYTAYDFRIDPAITLHDQNFLFNGNYTIRSLFQERLNQAFINWIVTLKNKYSSEYPIFDVILPAIQTGLDEALQEDFILINNFLKRFNLTIDDPESVLVFQHQCLTISKQDSLKRFNEHKEKYGKDTNQIITKNYALNVFLEAELEKYQVGISLENEISSSKYLQKAKIDKENQLLKTLITAKVFAENFKNDSDFNYANAINDIFEFETQIKDVEILPLPLFRETLDKKVELGYFYYSNRYNGNNLNFAVDSAKLTAKKNKDDIKLYVQANTVLQLKLNIQQSLLSGLEKIQSLIGKLKFIESNIRDKYTKITYVKALEVEYPNPDPKINEWLINNVDTKTRKDLEKKTKTLKMVESASQSPKSFDIMKSYDLKLDESENQKPQPAPWPINPRQEQLYRQQQAKEENK